MFAFKNFSFPKYIAIILSMFRKMAHFEFEIDLRVESINAVTDF